jgi:hypothetical protein
MAVGVFPELKMQLFLQFSLRAFRLCVHSVSFSRRSFLYQIRVFLYFVTGIKNHQNEAEKDQTFLAIRLFLHSSARSPETETLD